MNKINKKFNYPSEKPKGYFNNLHTKNGGWLHSSNKLLLDIVLDKILQKKKVITIFEFGSYMGLSAVYMAKKLNKKCNIICVDHWEGGFTITHKKSNTNKNKLKNKLYPQFITNTWEFKDMITPLRMDGREGMKYLYNLGIEPDFIYLDMDHEFEPVYGDLKILISLFPNTPIAGDDYEFHSGVREAIDTLRPFIQQYNIDTYKNIFLLSKYNNIISFNYYKSLSPRIKDNINILVIVHNNYKSVNKNKIKLSDKKNIYYFYLDKDDYDGLYLNCIINSIYKKYNINNIVFYNINYNYNFKFIEYINSKYNKLLIFDSLINDFSLSFMINYNNFVNNEGFDNLVNNEEIFFVFLYNYFNNNKITYKPLFNVIENKINYKFRSNIKNYDIIDLSNYNDIKYELKKITNYNNNIKVEFEKLNFDYKHSSDSLLNPLIYTIYPISKNKNNKILNKFTKNSINKLRNNKIIKERTLKLGYYKELNYDTIFTIFFNYINNYENILFLAKNKDNLQLKTINKYFKNIYNELNKNLKYNNIIYYFKEYTKNGTNYFLKDIDQLIDNNLLIKGNLILEFYNLPKHNDVNELLKIFGKFEKIIILKVNNYLVFNNNFWILLYNKLNKKDYETNIYDTSFYDCLKEIKKYKNNYREVIKKIKNIENFNYY